MDAVYDSRQDHTGPSGISGALQPHYSGFWIRLWAYLIDLIVVWSVSQMIIKPLFLLFKVQDSGSFIFSPANIMSTLVFFLYFVLLTKYFQQTLGKMIFGIKVIPLKNEELTWGTVLFRELVGRYICKTVFILYAVVAFTSKKQGIHDLFSDTSVIHEGTLRKAVNNS